MEAQSRPLDQNIEIEYFFSEIVLDLYFQLKLYFANTTWCPKTFQLHRILFTLHYKHKNTIVRQLFVPIITELSIV